MSEPTFTQQQVAVLREFFADPTDIARRGPQIAAAHVSDPVPAAPLTVQARRDELLFHAGSARKGQDFPVARIKRLSVLDGDDLLDTFVALIDAAGGFDQERMAALLDELTGTEAGR